jgi:hypothetical protein
LRFVRKLPGERPKTPARYCAWASFLARCHRSLTRYSSYSVVKPAQ